MHRSFIVLFLAALLLSSCGLLPQSGLQVQDAWVKSAKVSEIQAGDLNKSCICDVKTATFSTNAYLSIQNPGAQPDRLLKAESEGISRIEFRSTDQVNGLLNEKPLDAIDLPAHGSLQFASGGYAMLLMGMKKDLNPGETLKVALFFEKAGKLEVSFAIREP